MPATPAWPPHSLPRLFVDEALAEGASVDGGRQLSRPRCCGSGPATR